MTHTIRKLAAALVLVLLAPLAFAQGAFAPTMFTPFKKGGGSVGSGSTLTSCTSSILYADASSLLKCDPAAVVNGSVSTAGRSILTIRDTISGSSATSNFLNITGTFPATLSAETSGALVSITGDNDAQIQSGLKAIVTGSTTSNIYGVYGVANAASTNAGGVRGDSTGAASRGVGVWGTSSSTGAIGGFFGIGSAAPQSASYALGADNGNAAQDIFRAMDNGTAVFTIADGGASTFTANVNLNGGGIVPSNQGLDVGSSSAGQIGTRTVLTPDAPSFFTGSTSNTFHLSELADAGFDFQNACTTGLGTAACTDPTFQVHSHNQDTGEFLSMAHDGKAGVIVGGNSTVLDGTIRLGGTVTLTESSATNVLTIPVAVSTGTGGEIMYTVEAKDATNTQVRRGSVRYAVANNSSGTETCGVYGVDNAVTVNPAQTNDGSGAGAITSGTLTYAWSSDTSGTNSCVLKLNGVSSLTQTTFQIHYTVIQSGPGVSTGGD